MKSLARALSLGACLGLLAGMTVLAQGNQQEDRPAKVVVKIIADEDCHKEQPATLTVNGKPTKGTGEERHFVTPPLKADPKVKYFYVFVGKWQPNNYETYTRTRKVYVKPGDTVTVDMTKKDPNQPDNIVIRYVPTPSEFVTEMMKLGKVGKDDVVYDLGCGDGRIVIAAVSKYGAKKGVGFDIDPQRLKECKKNAEEAKVTDKVEFRNEDVFKIADLDKATVVTMYMSDGLNEQMWPVLQKHCKPGTRIVTHRFLMGKDNPPEKSVTVKSKENGFDYEQEVHLWTIKGDKGKEKKDK